MAKAKKTAEADFMGTEMKTTATKTKRGRPTGARNKKRTWSRRAKPASITNEDTITMPAPMMAAYRMGFEAGRFSR